MLQNVKEKKDWALGNSTGHFVNEYLFSEWNNKPSKQELHNSNTKLQNVIMLIGS